MCIWCCLLVMWLGWSITNHAGALRSSVGGGWRRMGMLLILWCMQDEGYVHQGMFIKVCVVGCVCNGKQEECWVVIGREECGANGVVYGGMEVTTKVVFVVSFWDKDMINSCSAPRLGACVVLFVGVKVLVWEMSLVLVLGLVVVLGLGCWWWVWAQCWCWGWVGKGAWAAGGASCGGCRGVVKG